LDHEAQIGSVVAIEVYAPMCWSTRLFLDVFSKDLEMHRIISLVNTYLLMEMSIHLIQSIKYTINSVATVELLI
jgi:hypothetical protein